MNFIQICYGKKNLNIVIHCRLGYKMARLSLLDFILIIIILSYFPSLIRSVENPIDLGEPPMWILPCYVDFTRKGWKFGRYNKLGQRRAFKKVGFEASRALERFIDMMDLWVLFSFHEFTAFKLHLWWRVHIPSNYLPTYNMTKKYVGGPIPKYEDSERDKLLKNLYEWLQRVGVGMEGLVNDQFKNVHDEPFAEPFVKAYYDLQMVLCAMDAVLFKIGISKEPDIDRGLMEQDERYIDDRNVRLSRDFNIVREYLNIMEYVVAVMRKLILTDSKKSKSDESKGIPTVKPLSIDQQSS